MGGVGEQRVQANKGQGRCYWEQLVSAWKKVRSAGLGTLGGPDSIKGEGRSWAGGEKQEGLRAPLGRLCRVRKVLIPGALFELITSY